MNKMLKKAGALLLVSCALTSCQKLNEVSYSKFKEETSKLDPGAEWEKFSTIQVNGNLALFDDDTNSLTSYVINCTYYNKEVDEIKNNVLTESDEAALSFTELDITAIKENDTFKYFIGNGYRVIASNATFDFNNKGLVTHCVVSTEEITANLSYKYTY